jgi:hypothetical protein
MKNYAFWLCLLLFPFVAQGQQKPRAYFMRDSIRLGDTLPVSFSFAHIDRDVVFFPDSSYDFSPFEYVSKRTFPTRTKDGMSRDSVIYVLRTFSMDSVQRLSLPVFILKKKQDTTKIFTDTIFAPVSFSLIKLPDSVVLKANERFVPFKQEFNTPGLITLLVSVISLLIIFYLLFGDRVRKMLRLKRLKNQFQKFKTDYERAVEHYQDTASTDHALGIWKKFLERMTDMPFSSLTTREIGELMRGSEYDGLKKALREIDMAIYGNQIGEKTKDALLFLKNYAEDTFENTIKKV